MVSTVRWIAGDFEHLENACYVLSPILLGPCEQCGPTEGPSAASETANKILLDRGNLPKLKSLAASLPTLDDSKEQEYIAETVQRTWSRYRGGRRSLGVGVASALGVPKRNEVNENNLV